MATTKDYISFILDQLSGLEDITCRSMMGEYIIYYKGRIAAYVCDNRLLVKPVEAAKKYIPDGTLEPPYAGAKDMLLVEDVDSAAYLKGLFEANPADFPEPQTQRRREKRPTKEPPPCFAHTTSLKKEKRKKGEGKNGV